jgi:rhodanese-related sulfurtransferase
MDLTDVLASLVDEGLGNSAYLLELGDGRALAVDASLDLRAVYAAAAQRGLRIAYAAETHLHADFLSGVRQLAVDHDARILASAAGDRTFDHVRLADGDEVDLGGLTLRTLATPGHTPEHLSLLVLDGGREVGVFTGGSLIVGAAARTDLVPLVIVRNPDQDQGDILWPALKVGYATIAGELAGGTAAWAASGGQLSTTRLVEPAHLGTATVVDVRQRSEYIAGHVPGGRLIELGDLAGSAEDLPAGSVTVMCGHGERAATAASLLERAGRTDVSILAGGAGDWAAATGGSLEPGA